MQSKVWPIPWLAVSSIRPAPTLANIPEMVTSAVQSTAVEPSAPSVSTIFVVASTALPGTWPRACTVASSGSWISVNSTSTTTCLLYTSDAADDLLCVDLGGRRIIKKKKKKNHTKTNTKH